MDINENKVNGNIWSSSYLNAIVKMYILLCRYLGKGLAALGRYSIAWLYSSQAAAIKPDQIPRCWGWPSSVTRENKDVIGPSHQRLGEGLLGSILQHFEFSCESIQWLAIYFENRMEYDGKYLFIVWYNQTMEKYSL